MNSSSSQHNASWSEVTSQRVMCMNVISVQKWPSSQMSSGRCRLRRHGKSLESLGNGEWGSGRGTWEQENQREVRVRTQRFSGSLRAYRRGGGEVWGWMERGSWGSGGCGKQGFGCSGEVWTSGTTRRQQWSTAVQNQLIMPQTKPEPGSLDRSSS